MKTKIEIKSVFGIAAVNYDLGQRMNPMIYGEIYLSHSKEELLKSL